jgi:hypothetical protein
MPISTRYFIDVRQQELTDEFLPKEQRVKNAMIEAGLTMKSILVGSTFSLL